MYSLLVLMILVVAFVANRTYFSKSSTDHLSNSMGFHQFPVSDQNSAASDQSLTEGSVHVNILRLKRRGLREPIQMKPVTSNARIANVRPVLAAPSRVSPMQTVQKQLFSQSEESDEPSSDELLEKDSAATSVVAKGTTSAPITALPSHASAPTATPASIASIIPNTVTTNQSADESESSEIQTLAPTVRPITVAPTPSPAATPVPAVPRGPRPLARATTEAITTEPVTASQTLSAPDPITPSVESPSVAATGTPSSAATTSPLNSAVPTEHHDEDSESTGEPSECSAEKVNEDLWQQFKRGAKPGVDAVYTYVDHSDPVWRRNFEAYMNTVRHRKRRSVTHTQVDLDEERAKKGFLEFNRFRNWNELRYSMRSLFTYGKSFIRNIYLVVSGPSQVPKWLNTSNPRIRIVHHDQLFEKRQLPTYNSLAIESVLHRIPGLSYHFLYMNNDVRLIFKYSQMCLMRSQVKRWICLQVFLNQPTELSAFITPVAYKSYLDWEMAPSNYASEAQCFDIPFNFTEHESYDMGARAPAKWRRRFTAFDRVATQRKCMDNSRIPFFLDRWLAYRTNRARRTHWAAHIPHLWDRCALAELERGPLRPWFARMRNRRNRMRQISSDVSMHLQYELLLQARAERAGHSIQLRSWHRSQMLEQDKRDQREASPPEVRQFRQLRMKQLQPIDGTYYYYVLFSDEDLFALTETDENTDPTSTWHGKVAAKLQQRQQFVCIDDNLSSGLANGQTLQANEHKFESAAQVDAATEKHRLLFNDVMNKTWPSVAPWEIPEL
jgi:hypothetical protein